MRSYQVEFRAANDYAKSKLRPMYSERKGEKGGYETHRLPICR